MEIDQTDFVLKTKGGNIKRSVISYISYFFIAAVGFRNHHSSDDSLMYNNTVSKNVGRQAKLI